MVLVNKLNFESKLIKMNIVITGASRGIGYELCKVFAKDLENNVFAIARNSEKLSALSAEINQPDRFHFLAFNLHTSDYTKQLVPEIRTWLGRVDILINNAGSLLHKSFQEISDEDFDTIFDMNVKSPFKMIRDLLPLFNKLAHIVNISSMGGVQGSVKFPGLSLYSASKGALAILTECLALEFKDLQLYVNALAIGAVQTEMLAEAFPGYQAPLHPDQMASFIKEFALTGHRYFNGKILPVSLSTP